MNRSMIPDDIDGFRSDVINGILKCIRALWPLQSATIMFNPTSNGMSAEIKRMSGGGANVVFSGTAYIAGNKTTGLGTKAWVRCFLDSATAEDNDGPAPNPFPINEEWYEVANTYGDIHIPRA